MHGRRFGVGESGVVEAFRIWIETTHLRFPTSWVFESMRVFVVELTGHSKTETVKLAFVVQETEWEEFVAVHIFPNVIPVMLTHQWHAFSLGPALLIQFSALNIWYF